MGTRKQRRVWRDWPKVMNDFARSGLSIKQYCQKHKINQGLFFRWQKRLAPEVSSGRGAPKAFYAGDFIELSLAGSPVLSIRFPDGVEVSVQKECRAELIQTIIAQLQEAAC